MREILFRGRISKNEWVYGLPIEGEPLVGEGKRTCIVTNPGLTYYDGVLMTYDECVEVDPDTIGQFTGLTDRNGVKIFEGDIVLHKGECGLVGYSYDYGIFEVDFDYCFAGFIDISASNCEVIGNIYDTPELLEASKND